MRKFYKVIAMGIVILSIPFLTVGCKAKGIESGSLQTQLDNLSQENNELLQAVNGLQTQLDTLTGKFADVNVVGEWQHTVKSEVSRMVSAEGDVSLLVPCSSQTVYSFKYNTDGTVIYKELIYNDYSAYSGSYKIIDDSEGYNVSFLCGTYTVGGGDLLCVFTKYVSPFKIDSAEEAENMVFDELEWEECNSIITALGSVLDDYLVTNINSNNNPSAYRRVN